eukprot:1990474-Pleurochrysis_carterae.AAC.1
MDILSLAIAAADGRARCRHHSSQADVHANQRENHGDRGSHRHHSTSPTCRATFLIACMSISSSRACSS